MCECCAVDMLGWAGSHIGRSHPAKSQSPESCFFAVLTVCRKWNHRTVFAVTEAWETVRRDPLSVFVSSIEPDGIAGQHFPTQWAYFNKDRYHDIQA
ncbi:hypothetical protein RRH01S_07_04550 [Rhizobium rhizogenes NBRC 13257]|uniref:Uncharacterized protein n=1 Tax=Rhizobium rhizogenes NBRC 13257 TaxID=1220581 RepID=A0AA87QAP6_RHIRH|nr:hypothetical protein RRH01S_07_04550 [Rhizobium rhizogenes NBRC 13257]